MRVNQIVREADLAKAVQGEEGTFVAQQSNAYGQPIGPALVVVVKRGHSIISCRPVIEATVLPWELRKISEGTEAAQEYNLADTSRDRTEQERRRGE